MTYSSLRQSEEEEHLPLGSHLEHIKAIGGNTSSYRKVFYIAVALLLTNLCSILGTAYLSRSQNATTLDLPYSPANDFAKLEYRFVDEDPVRDLFMGEPRPEYEQAWDDLLQGAYIRLTEEDLERTNNTISIAHQDGGYVGGIRACHDLHWLKSIGDFVHADHYPPHILSTEVRMQHLDHCLESIRQALMCNPDLSVGTVRWTHEKTAKFAAVWSLPSRCVNWDTLQEWLVSRKTSVNEFVNPVI